MTGGGHAPLAIAVGVAAGAWPSQEELEAVASRVAAAVFAELGLVAAPGTELSVVFTDDAAVQALNAQWRAKNKPTNVLSFPAMPFPTMPFPTMPPGFGGNLPPMLGDIVLASETVRREAEAEGKPFENHLAHLVAHGLLHLLGFDHEADAEAEAMEDVERRALARLAIPDPYA